MTQNQVNTFQDAVQAVESLPAEEQEELIDLIQRRLRERRRAEIARHAEETLRAVREGRAHYGTVEDLRRDLTNHASPAGDEPG